MKLFPLVFSFAACLLGTQEAPTPVGVELTLSAPNDPVEIGHPALVHVHLENKSPQSYQIRPSRAYIEFILTLCDSSGRNVAYKRSGLRLLGGSVFGPEELPPGATLDDDEDLSRLFDVTAPGLYHISGSGKIEGHKRVDAPKVAIAFEGRN